MLRLSLCTADIVATAGTAQVTPYKTTNESSVPDPDKVVCEREERIGSRLASKKVCLTVREWELRKNADRQQMEDAQAGARMSPSADPPDTPTGPGNSPP